MFSHRLFNRCFLRSTLGKRLIAKNHHNFSLKKDPSFNNVQNSGQRPFFLCKALESKRNKKNNGKSQLSNTRSKFKLCLKNER